MTSLQDATVLVTGANGGLGSGFVTAALDRGARRVYATARSPKQWNDERIRPLQLDVTDPASIERAAELASDTTILVNNAAIFPRGDLLTAPFDDITTTIDTNLIGPIRLTRALAPSLRAANGALVKVASVLSWLAVGKAHSVSKAGLWSATNAFRLEFAPEGVQVLGAFPGPTDTPMQAGADRDSFNKVADVVASIFDALVAGEDEVLVDKMTERVHAALSQPLTALYPSLGSR
ncbi:SDR family oxidoreductase [Streptomyces sp. NPDC058653]|uniref:SDR family oxidoreductase n=1 Tax=Streptomyces sp. NPDC058653 TaxID=3346576 RepID=UPI0036595355